MDDGASKNWLETMRAALGPISKDDFSRIQHKFSEAQLARAIACGSHADIATSLRRVNPRFLDPSILKALADRLENPRGNKTRAAAVLHRTLAAQVDGMFRFRLRAGERKYGLKKRVVETIAALNGVSPRLVYGAIKKKPR
jgi:hypothetical protein